MLLSFRIGQLGALLLFATSICLWGLEKKNPLLLGLGLSLFSIKPHIAMFFVIAIIIWIFKEKLWPTFIWGILFFSIYLLVIEEIFSGSIGMWVEGDA